MLIQQQVAFYLILCTRHEYDLFVRLDMIFKCLLHWMMRKCVTSHKNRRYYVTTKKVFKVCYISIYIFSRCPVTVFPVLISSEIKG